jgi:hypothetical protein
VQHFKNYRTRLADVVGDKNASDIIRNALFICSMGTNDFAVTYFGLQIRRAQMNVEQYQEFLLKEANNFIQVQAIFHAHFFCVCFSIHAIRLSMESCIDN